MPARSETRPAGGGIAVLVVDDHPVLRGGLLQLLEQELAVASCAQADTGREALERARARGYDLAIVDLALPDVDGIDLIKDLKARCPELAILVYTMRDEELYAERALRAGARGYVMKSSPPDVLIDAVRHVLQGRIHLSDALADTVLRRVFNGDPEAPASPVSALSDRELQVFTLIGEGLGPAEIAERLHLSAYTIETYRAHIRTKLDLPDAAAVRRFAIQWAREWD